MGRGHLLIQSVNIFKNILAASHDSFVAIDAPISSHEILAFAENLSELFSEGIKK